MKIFFGSLLVFVNLLSASTVAKDRSNDLTIKIVEISRSGEITVGVSNSSTEPIRVWRESNSWGAAHWRVLLIREGQLRTFFQNLDQLFTKNNPAFDEIAAGAHIEKSSIQMGRIGVGWMVGRLTSSPATQSSLSTMCPRNLDGRTRRSQLRRATWACGMELLRHSSKFSSLDESAYSAGS
jgi:hypothetical protein